MNFPALLRRHANAVNSVFGRLALLAIALLVLIQVTWTIVVVKHQSEVEADHIGRLVLLASDATGVSGDPPSSALRARLAKTLEIRFIESGTHGSPVGCPNLCASTNGPFEAAIGTHLPPQSLVVLDRQHGEVWVRAGTASVWIVIPAAAPSAWRLASANAATLLIALGIALLGAWQVERPLLRLARAARQLRVGQRPGPLHIEGPSEVKALTQDFNEMARTLIDAEQERAVMLAGVAHDLRAPLTRIQVRATMVEHGDLQAGFLQDIASLSQIVTQFLDLARDADDETDVNWVQVDRFCTARYGSASREHGDAQADDGENGDGAAIPDISRYDDDDPLVLLRLEAGDDFMLPGIELDRILSNLIENAFAYGAPPLLISTARQHGEYRLSVTDHGAGMPSADFERALRPFVRLDAARGGDAHCGLGLTIVRRLARRYGGEVALTNAPGAGLCVTLTFPENGMKDRPKSFVMVS